MKSPIVLYEPPKRARTGYRIGLLAWTDKSRLDQGTFYPRKTMTAEERLWWYSRFFDVVEVNSSFYAIPSVDTAGSWIERTPAGFLFNVKAFGLLTDITSMLRDCPTRCGRCFRRARESNSADASRIVRSGDEARAWAFDEMRPGRSSRMKRSPTSRHCRVACPTRSSPLNLGIDPGSASTPTRR